MEVRTGGSKPDFSAPREVTSVSHDIDLISIMPDGKRILATRPVGERSASHMDMILNLQHLLK